MRSGQLRHKVSLYKPSTARAADGSIETVLDLLGTFYASLETESLSESSVEDKMVSYVSHRITFRYNSTDLTEISGDCQIHLDGTKMHVLSATVKDYRNRMIEVVAEART